MLTLICVGPVGFGFPLCQTQTHDQSASERITDTITAHTLPDVEDLCTVCEPLPAERDVTTYPMKAERKKAREELDIVNVVEWRHTQSGDRWFLLVRRPEGGEPVGHIMR